MIYKVRDRGHSEPIIAEHLKGAIDNNKKIFYLVFIKKNTKFYYQISRKFLRYLNEKLIKFSKSTILISGEYLVQRGSKVIFSASSQAN